MSTHNIGFYEEISKTISSLSSNTHLISSSEFIKMFNHRVVAPNGSVKL